jgi:hypothetical protein
MVTEMCIAVSVLCCGAIACSANDRGVFTEEIIVPIGYYGWVEIVQDDPACPNATIVGKRIVITVNDMGIACIADELPALRWHKSIYRYADGQPVPESMVQGEAAIATASFRHFVKHSSLLCLGKREDCGSSSRPKRLPPGPGWHEVSEDRRVEIRVP